MPCEEIERAIRLLPGYQADLSALALELDFASHSHFTTAFASRLRLHACGLSRASAPRLQEHYVASFSASRNDESISRRTSCSPSTCLTLSCAAFNVVPRASAVHGRRS